MNNKNWEINNGVLTFKSVELRDEDYVEFGKVAGSDLQDYFESLPVDEFGYSYPKVSGGGLEYIGFWLIGIKASRRKDYIVSAAIDGYGRWMAAINPIEES